MFGLAVPAQAADAPTTLTWGIKQSFVSYITGPIAHGSITTSGNATGAYPFSWSSGSSTLNADATAGSASFTGTVAFTGHGGLLDLTLSNPRIELTGATTGTLYADVVSKSLSSGQPESFPGVAFASLVLPAATISDSTATWSGVTATLTETGAPAFAGFYAAGTALDTLSLSAPVAAPAPTATTTTLAASPTGTAAEGSSVALTATVTPDAAGTVEFFDGSASLGNAAVASGAASTSVSTLAVGAHSLSATFTPADAASFAGSTSAALEYTISASPQPAVPTVTVSQTTGLDPAGQTVTVAGSAFLPDAPATTATRAPIAGSFGGAYIAFGSYANGVWTGAPRSAATTKWGVHAAQLAAIGGAAAGGVVIGEDGSFQTEITVTDGVAPGGGTWGIRTYSGGGASYAPFETFTPVTFADPEPEPAPEITVTPAENLDPAVANTLTVDGSGFEGPAAVNGVYVLFGETSVWNGDGPLPQDGWIVQAWVQPAQIADGGFTTTLTIPAGRLDPAATYQVATSAAHALSQTDRSLDAFAPVGVADDAPAGPRVSIGNDGASVAQGGVLQVTGTGLPAGESVTAIVFSDPVTIGTAAASGLGVVAFSWTVPADFPVGAHTLQLSVGGASVASIPFTVTAAAVAPVIEEPQATTCVARAVSGASIQWGVKESFRTYVTGPIADGSIAGGWGAGSGAYSTDNDRGRVGFGGSIHYTGHGGLLDLTLSNPRIQVDSATSASLILTVQSKGFNGSPDINASAVAFATLALPAATETSSRISWSGATATLTAAGADAFAGFYSAGQALDPVSFAFPLGTEVECDSSTSLSLAATGGEQRADVLWLGAGMLILGAGLVALRRRAQRA